MARPMCPPPAPLLRGMRRGRITHPSFGLAPSPTARAAGLPLACSPKALHGARSFQSKSPRRGQPVPAPRPALTALTPSNPISVTSFTPSTRPSLSHHSNLLVPHPLMGTKERVPLGTAGSPLRGTFARGWSLSQLVPRGARSAVSEWARTPAPVPAGAGVSRMLSSEPPGSLRSRGVTQ